MVKRDYYRIIYLIAGGFILIFTAAVAIYEFELSAQESNIRTLPDAIWYTIVTLTTVGYGDMVPLTGPARTIAYVLLFLSLIIYGFFVGQISSIMSSIKEKRKMGVYGTSFEHHAVIIGWDDFARAVTDQLVGVDKQVAIVTNKKDDLDLIQDKYQTKQVFTLYSDLDTTDQLDKCNIEKAAIVFVNLGSDTDKLVYILNLKKSYVHLNYVVTLDNANLKHTFHSAGVIHTISKHEIASKLLASYMFEPDVAEYSEDIMSYPQSDDDYDVKQFKVLDHNAFMGKRYGEVFLSLKKEFNAILIGMTKITDDGKEVLKNPKDDVLIEEGDYLIMILNGNAFKSLRSVFKTEEGFLRT